MEENKNIGVTTKIHSISLNNFKVADISKEQKKSLNKDKFAFEFNMNVKIEPKKKEITIHNLTTIFADDSKTNYLGEIEATGVFELQNFEEVTEASKGMMPNGIIAMYIGLLLSTTRGMLLLKTEGTAIEGALMPIVNTGSFFSPKTTAEQKK